ncbi:PAS domain-containing sensor histidine kinase [Cellulosilyticum ruminicola]|uniref:PAS domain-containing sensor histidine kinase n=1 Tax=Cellulosilyticum ruminicola TaxID=425254 RepID=UPI0006D27EC7|nr:HAMP domain-containing sensor histidine kinase [Cellulosilyticum ruminicola]
MNRSLLDYISEGVVILNKEFKVQIVSEKLLKALGYMENAENRSIQNIIQTTSESIQLAEVTNDEITIQMQTYQQEGVSLKGKVFLQEWDGQLCYWILVKVPEKGISRNELTLILDNMPYCIWIADEEENYRYVNCNANLMFNGIFENKNSVKDNNIKQNTEDIYRKKIKAAVIKNDQETLKQGIMVNEERRTVNMKDELPYQIVKVPIFREGQYRGYIGIVEYNILKYNVDIRKVIGDTVLGNMMNQERFYSQLVELLEFSETAERMLQEKMVIILKDNPHQGQVEEISRLQKKDNKYLMKNNLIIDKEVILQMLSESNTWPIEDFEERIGSNMGYVLDKTEKYHVRIKPIEYNSEFMGTILTVYSSNSQYSLMDACIINKVCQHIAIILKSVSYAVEFEQEWSKRKAVEAESTAYKKALELETLKTELLANISHELKTPLNIIYSVLQSFDLEFKELEKIYNISNIYNKLVHYEQVTKQNIYRLLRLINNITDISKMGAGYYDVKLVNGEIVREIEDITMSVVEYFKEKELSIIFDTEVEELEMAYDPEKIERIMLNLLSNAVKYTNPGGLIEVNLYVRDETLIIAVKDSGIGIPQEKQAMIFKRFAQVDSSFTRKCEGSGIGLALVKSLVEKQGGTITVESEEGKGSTFKVMLPIVHSQTVVSQAHSMNGREEQLNYKCKVEFSDIYDK